MKFNLNFLKYKMNCGIIAFVLVIFICSVTLFIKPVIGMADNGDFFRIISQSNLYYLPENNENKFLGYFNKDYGIYKYNNENTKTLISTQFIFTKAAVFLDKLLTRDYVFDIRFLSLIYIIIYAFSAYLIIKLLTYNMNSIKYKFLITALFIFIFCDTGYIAYFNSFYGEALNITSFMLSAGILLYMYKFKKYTITNLLSFFIFSIIFIGSKQQLAPVGLLTSAVLFRLLTSVKDKLFRFVTMGLIAVILGSSMYFYKSISGDFDYINRYHAMTRGALLYEEKPDDILRQFNINPQYSLLGGTIFFNQIPVINPNDAKLKKDFYSNYSFFSLLKFYLKNPKILLKMINFSVKNGYSIRPPVMGNYEKSEGKPYGSRSYFFSAWSSIKEHYMPHNLFLTIIAFGIYFGFSAKRYIRARRNNDIDSQLFEEAFVYIFFTGISQLFVSVIGAGDADLGKHVFMFNVTFDIIFLYSVYLIIREIDAQTNVNTEKEAAKCQLETIEKK